MIKTENDIFYMSAGEACYTVRNAGGKLLHLWWGARIEPEDDVCSGAKEADELLIEIGGKRVELEVRGYEVTGKPLFDAMPSARGGETLVVHLRGVKAAVEVDAMYTPYPRGGIMRRVAVRNVGSKKISVKATLCLSAVGSARRERGYIEVSGDGTFGVAALYGGGYDFEADGGIVRCSVSKDVEIGQGELFVSPEILCVYSDGDGEKAARVFRDIVRENIIAQKYFGARRPLSLLCSDIMDGRGRGIVDAAKQIGADSLVVDCGGAQPEGLAALSAECKSGGIRLGVAFDLTAYPDPQKAADALITTIENSGADIVALRGFDRDGDYAYWQSAYALVRTIAKCDTEPTVGGACDLGSLCYTALCVEHDDLTILPPCARCGVVYGKLSSLKTEFDLASFGCLCYALDIGGLTDGVKRAIRAQVFSYQDDADLIMSGDLYSHADGSGELTAAVSKDKSSAYAVYKRGGGEASRIKLFGLDAHNLYYVRELDKTFSGAALRYYGIAAAEELEEGETLSLHLVQVVDYD